jgi:hypothetical protein
MAKTNMDDQELVMREYLVPRASVQPLLTSFSVVRNRLGEVFDLPKGDAGQATRWWQGQKPDDQIVLRQALTALASPIIMSDITIMRGDQGLVQTTLVKESLRVDDPAFLVGTDQGGENLRLRRLQSPEVMAGTILMYLEAGSEPGLAEFKFEVSPSEFLVLLATLDLHRRSYLISLLEHEEMRPGMKLEDVQNSLSDGLQYPDPRWLVPFVVPILPEKPQLDWNALWQAVQSLGQRGLVKLSGDNKELTLTEAGALMATEMLRKMTQVRIASLGYTEDSRQASQTSFFIRGESLIWYMDVGAESVVVAAVDLDKAGELLVELFKPVGAQPVAAPVKEAPGAARAQPATAPAPTVQAKPKVRYCPSCGQPATWIEQYKRWYCYSCQKYLEQ